MKHLIHWAALSVLVIAVLASCEKDEQQDPNAPFIESLEMSGDTLFINGAFGDVPGTVYVDDKALEQGNILGWTENTIICYIQPPVPEEIEVVVKVNDKQSNRKKFSRNSGAQMRIDYLLVNEQTGTLQIYGQFGNQPGSVKVNNVPVPEVVTWSNPLILCKIPYDGDGSYGKVTISAGGKSASRTLLQWTVYYECFRPQSGVTGSLQETMGAQIYIRGDRGPVPANVFLGGNPELYPEGYCLYKTGGTTGSNYDCGTVTAEWGYVEQFIDKSSGFHDWPTQTHFQARKTHRPDGFDINLDVLFWNVISAKVTIAPCSGPSSTHESTRPSDLLFVDGLTDLPLRFDPAGNNFKADSITETVSSSAQLIWNAEDGHLYQHTAKLRWSSFVSDKP